MRNAPRNPAPRAPLPPEADTVVVGPEALDPPALREVAETIVREFPLVVRRTGLVLYDVDPRHLQAQWQVTADDLNRARSAFPPGAAGVRPVLRLLGLDADGGSKEVAALPQPPAQGPLEGEAVFTVGDQGRRFQAELGLASGDGGWLLLARSDPVEPPRAIARPFLVRQVPAAERPTEPAPIRAPAAMPPVAGPVPRPAVPLPRPRDAAPGESPEIDLTLAPAVIPLAPQFPNPLEAPRAEGLSQGRREATPRFRIPHSDLPPPILPSSLDSWSGEGGLLAQHDPTHGLSSRALHGPAPGDLELHAELVVWGRAPAGSLVEVLGRRLRVGQDGRFLVQSLVEDPGAFGIALSGAAAGEPGESEAE
jgi:hypothetical protein